jgi:predicted permease
VLSVLGVVAPVFVIVAAGWGAARFAGFAPAAVDGLLAFTVRFGAPTLLFGAMVKLDFGRAFDAGLLLSFYAGALASFATGVAIARLGFRRTPGESVAIGFCALFSNSLLLGVPIMTRAYGADALEANFAILSIHAPFCYLVGIVTMEIARRDGASARETARRAAVAMFSNALAIGLALGFAVNMSGLALPGFLATAVDMIGSAALPVALFAIGGALDRYALRADIGEAATAAVLATLVHPLLTFALGTAVFDVTEAQLRSAVVTAAMPTGMNGYVFAAMYARAQGAAAGAVLLGTAAAPLTVTFWLWLLGGAAG